MKIIINTIPHNSQFYETIGDWYTDKDGVLNINVSEMGNDDYNVLVAIHELIEAYLCKKRGINQDDVTEFDKKMLLEGITEPGADPRAPYYHEHAFASAVEMLIAHQLGVKEYEYDEAMLRVYVKGVNS